jgi:PhnB protein
MIMPILSVQDLEASIAFYTKTLGFEHTMTMPDNDGKPNFAIVTLGTDSTIGLQSDPAATERGRGVSFMVYVADSTDIDAYYADVQKHGAKVTQPLKTEYWGDRVFGLSDPDHFELMLCKTVQQLSPEEIVAAGTKQA